MDEDLLFEELLNTHGTEILQFIRFYTKDLNEAEDLTQEVFMRAYRKRHDLPDIQTPKAWLLRIAVNLCRDYYRERLRHPVELVEVVDSPSFSAQSAEDTVLQREDALQVIGQVLALPPKYKDVIVLRYFEEMTLEEIAWTIGTPVSTVKSRLHYARSLMRRQEEGLSHEPQR